jgi:hypothetical protein
LKAISPKLLNELEAVYASSRLAPFGEENLNNLPLSIAYESAKKICSIFPRYITLIEYCPSRRKMETLALIKQVSE